MEIENRYLFEGFEEKGACNGIYRAGQIYGIGEVCT